MLNSRWLYVSGLVITSPVVVVLCAAAVSLFLSGDTTIGWSSGGKLPPSATSNFDMYLITGIATIVCAGGLFKVVRMFRADEAEERS